MIAAQCDDLGFAEVLDAALGALLGRSSTCELQICLAHLPQSKGIVEGCDRDISAIDDASPGREGVEACSSVVTTEGGLARRPRADRAGTESSSWAVGYGGVEGCTKNGNIVRCFGVGQAARVR
jgi:hypothetical protein